MSQLVRRRAFVACATALICAALVTGLPSDPPTEACNSGGRAKALVTGGRGAAVAPDERAARAPAPSVPDSLARARARARAFARAFVGYQAGDSTGRSRALLALAASDRVRRALAASPPRRAGKPPRAELGAVHVYPARPGAAKGSAVLRYRTGQRLLEFMLARRTSGWRVTELYP